MPVAEAEWLYFGSALNEQYTQKKAAGGGAALHCALCDMDLENGTSPRFHIFGSSRASHTNHTCREVLLDSLALLGMRGFPLDAMYHVWSDVLYRHPLFTRVRGLVSPMWTLEQRASQLSQLLLTLRDMNIIDIALAVRSAEPSSTRSRRRMSFERIEYIGDNSWGTNISSRMMLLFPNEQWQYSERCFSFNCFRDACEMNIMLNAVFDALHLRRLLAGVSQESLDSGKSKADVVEAILGELHLETFGRQPAMYDDSPFIEVSGVYSGRVCALVEHCLTEMYDLIVLLLTRELMQTALPMAKKVAASYLWMRSHVSLFRSRHRRSNSHERKSLVSATSSSSSTSSSCMQTDTSSSHPTDQSATTHAPTSSSGTPDTISATRPPISSASTTTETCTTRAPTRVTTSRLDGHATTHRCTLPALPYLASAPHRYPCQLPHPLLAAAASPSQDSAEIVPACTVSAYTGKDVFASIRGSFDRLGLMTDDARQYVCVLPPSAASSRLGKLARSLVPGLTLAAHDCATTSEPEEHGRNHRCTSAWTACESDSSYPVAGNEGSHEADDTKWSVVAMDEHDYYITDPYYSLASQPPHSAALHTRRAAAAAAADTPVVSALSVQHVKEPVEMALNWMRPILDMSAPEHTRDHKGGSNTNDDSSVVGSVQGWPADLFAPSRWVEESVKPPTAGVVTDKNLARGRFAFLGYGYREHHRRNAAQPCLEHHLIMGAGAAGDGGGGSPCERAAIAEDGALSRLKELEAVEEECQRMQQLGAVRTGVTALSRTWRVPTKSEKGAGAGEAETTTVVDVVATTQFWSTLIRRRRSSTNNSHFHFFK